MYEVLADHDRAITFTFSALLIIYAAGLIPSRRALA
jgi:hypothetical protein